MDTDKFISEFLLKILLIEDKFHDIRPAVANLLNCENIFAFVKNADGWIVKNSSDNQIQLLNSGIYLLDPIKSFDKQNPLTITSSVVEDINNPQKMIINIKDFLTFCNNSNINFDLFLIDLKLFGEKQNDLSGRLILEEFKKSFPYAPVFIFTWTYDKDEIIKDIKDSQADYYVHKGEIHILDSIIENYYKRNFGKTWLCIRKSYNNDAYILRKAILTWRRNPKLLWHGEKATHLVDHTYEHSRSMYEMLNKLLICQPKIEGILNENLFYLAMSVWLHDIGLKGYKDLFWPYEIRKYHPIISGYLIDKYPEIYLLGEYDKKIKENIALLCTYHLFAAPLTSKMLEMDRVRKLADEEFQFPCKHNFLNEYIQIPIKYVTLDSINMNLLLPACLLRFLDVLDKGVHRVGIYEEEDVKWIVCLEDAGSLKKKLDEEVKKISDQLGTQKYLKSVSDAFDDLLVFINKVDRIIESLKENYQELINEIRSAKSMSSNWENRYIFSYSQLTEVKREKEILCRKLERSLSSALIKNCITMLDQALFYLETPLHFITHRTFKKIEFENDENKIDIIYVFNDDFVEYNDSISFAQYNRLFQESWKVFSDILREYQPLEEILKKDNIEFKNVNFVGKDKEEKDIIFFSFDLTQSYIEKEIRLYFETEKEQKNLLEELKNIFEITEESNKEEITDEFYDYKDNDDWGLAKRGWSFRKRILQKGEEEKIIWSIKIKPIYWKGEYENRIEIEVKADNPAIQNFENLLAQQPFMKKPNLDQFVFENFLGENIALCQSRKPGIINLRGLEIKYCEGHFNLKNRVNDKKEDGRYLYFIEFEAPKNLKPWEQAKIMEDLLDELYSHFSGIDKFLSTESKLIKVKNS